MQPLDHPALPFVASRLALRLVHGTGFSLQAWNSHDEDKDWPKQKRTQRPRRLVGYWAWRQRLLALDEDFQAFRPVEAL